MCACVGACVDCWVFCADTAEVVEELPGGQQADDDDNKDDDDDDDDDETDDTDDDDGDDGQENEVEEVGNLIVTWNLFFLYLCPYLSFSVFSDRHRSVALLSPSQRYRSRCVEAKFHFIFLGSAQSLVDLPP